MQGGGGPLLTGTIEESKAYNCHSELCSLAQFGMTPAEAAERHPQSDPSGNLTKEVSTKAEKYLSLRADECRRGNPVKNASPSCHSELVSESVPRYERVSNVGQTLKRVQGDNISSLRAVGDRAAIHSTLVLRLAFSCSTRGKRAYVLSALRTPLAHANATARACGQKRAGQAGLITSRSVATTYCGCASGTPRRALDSTQGKPCSVALPGLTFTMAARLSRSTESRAIKGLCAYGRRIAFTMAARLSRFHNGLVGLRSAFTMAEILLSLTIIGVVAAITLPSLTGNINERTWNTQRKALYARFSQAIALMPSLNGYGTYSEETDSSGSISITDNVAETFVTAGLSKVLKINNICDSDHIRDCGIASKIVSLKGTTIETENIKDLQGLNGSMVGSIATTSTIKAGYNINNTKAAAFETANGESILVYYVPNCVGNMKETTFTGNSDTGRFYIQQRVCANFIFDLNGNKGPNTVGKDIGFMTAFYPYDAQLAAPYPAINYVNNLEINSETLTTALKYCSETFNGEYRLAKIDELSSMFVNNKLIDAQNIGGHFVSSDKQPEKLNSIYPRYSQSLTSGEREETGARAWCVKR